jgi:hypothetical protein
VYDEAERARGVSREDRGDTRRAEDRRARLREQGYADGYARRPCRSALRTYQVSYRMGSIARDAQEEGDDAA